MVKKNIFNPTQIKQYIKYLTELVFPPVCVFCNKKISRPHTFEDVCRNCLSQIPFRTKTKSRIKCLEKRNSDNIEEFIKFNIDVIIACYYEKMIRKSLVSMKFYGNAHMKNILGSIASRAIISQNESFDAIVPIPLHTERLRERGYNQAELIAEKVSRIINIPLIADCLIRKKKTNRQSEMERYEDRLQNVSNAFYCIKPEKLIGKSILLIDDVLTSGETMISAAGAINDAVEKYIKSFGKSDSMHKITGVAIASSRK